MGAIRGSSRDKIYHELGLESLQCRRWYRKLCLFYKIFKENKSVYLFNLIPSKNSNYNTRNAHKITPFHAKHSFFKNSFFLSTFTEWSKLDPNLWSAASFSVFQKNLFKFIRPSPNSAFNCHNYKGIKYLKRLRLGISHLREHQLKHSFQEAFFDASFSLLPLVYSSVQLMILIVLWQIIMIRYWLMFFLVYISKYPLTHCNNELYYINEQIWRKSFLVFLYISAIFSSL